MAWLAQAPALGHDAAMAPPASANLQRPLALITGASSGIGEAFARALAADGHDLALVARRADRLEALAAELAGRHGIDAFAIPADLSLWEGHQPVLNGLAARGRTVELLINNAGFSIAQSFDGVAWDRQRDFLMTLINAPMGLAHGLIPGMVTRGHGRIINVASLAGFAPGVAGHTLYPGAKSLMIKATQALDAEYRSAGLKITAICPGFTQTEFAQANGTDAIMDEAPRRLFQTPEQVVAAALSANAAGRVIVVPGWHNWIAAVLLQYLPQSLVRMLLIKGSAKYHLKAEE
jgi:short-subunit dehydrogenase